MTDVRTIISRVLLVLYLVTVGILLFSSFPGTSLAGMSLLGIPADKLEHFILFLPYAVLAYFSVKPCFDNRSKLPLMVAIFVSGILIGGATELVQYLLPARECDLHDFIADALSVSVSSAVLTFAVVRK